VLLADIQLRLNPRPWSPPVPRAVPTIRSELFDQLAGIHESAHCVWNWVRREPVYSVEIEGRGMGGGEFKSTPTSGTIELRDDCRAHAHPERAASSTTRARWLLLLAATFNAESRTRKT
jgi:hypothetical protein